MNTENGQEENIIEKKRKIEKLKKKKSRKKVIILLLILLALFMINGPLKGDKDKINAKFDYEKVVADFGDIEVIVEGKGVVEENSVYNISPVVNGEIIEDYVEVGQMVNKDDLLYVIDSTDIQASISSAKLAVEQATISYNNIQKQINDLKIVANDSGFVSDLTVTKGAYIATNSSICSLVETNQYEVVLQFMNAAASQIRVGNKATLTYMSYLTTIDGIVTNVSDRTFLRDDGSQVSEVTIRVTTAGFGLNNAIVKGEVYTDLGTIMTSANTASMTSVTNNMVKAKSTGTVQEVHVKNGDYIERGTVIATLENVDLETSLSNAEIALKNAKNSLTNAEKQLDNYNIKSPITGMIAYKNNKLGDIISNFQNTNSKVMVTIVDNSVKKFDMEVDELDIAKVKVGQEVLINIDALQGNEYTGKVSNINTIGKSVAGITSYTVTVELETAPEIYAGMNVDADIQIISIQDIMRVPLSAVRKGNVVYKQVDDATYQDEDSSVPAGYQKVKVEIGQNNSDYIEIISGLEVGDVVLIDKLTQSGVIDFSSMSPH